MPAPPHASLDIAAAERQLRARALAILFLAGASIGLVSMLLPHYAKADGLGLYSNIVLAYVGAALMAAIGPRVRMWMIHAALITGSLLISRAILLSAEPVSFYSVWYIWVGLYAFYFCSRRAAAGHVSFVALLYAITLVSAHSSSPVARWLTTVATLVVAGLFIDTLLRRARRQATVAEASASTMAMAATVAHQLAGLAESTTARETLCEAAARVTGAAGLVLWEPTADRTKLAITAATGFTPAQNELRLPGPPAGAARAFLTATTITAITTERPDLAPELHRDAGLEGLLWKPIVRDQEPVAVLAFYWQDPGTIRSPPSLTLTDLLAAEAAATLERIELLARLESIARTDELTGLPNRRAWQEQLPRELDRARRGKQPLCVAMLDIDHFKRYNDERGHIAGDRLLKETATVWCSQLRPTDLLARYGGEEFVIALPGCPLDEALEVIERVRKATPSGQTCSSGIALWNGVDSPGELLGRADQALYEAKRRGRDQSNLAQGTVASEEGAADDLLRR